ncbi:MAG: DUF1697 domain-containing protein [Gammaproteobacteria bacterium]|nr:DUF1697 domain-containing protein [Gammaproteobacteria bacterium]
MTTQIALLRGINVGGKGRLPMQDLVSIFESVGCKRVRTYIQSGNVVFECGDDVDAGEIGRRIMAKHGFEPFVLILDNDAFGDAVAENPFTVEDGKALHFFFWGEPPAYPDLDGLAALRASTEVFSMGSRAFYLHAPDGVGRSKLAARVETALGVPVTARNWNTVAKLADMAGLSIVR